MKRNYVILSNSLPNLWSLVDQYEGNFIFENSDKSFCVNVDCFPDLKYPYSVTFTQLNGANTKIGIENGGYSTYGCNVEEARVKAIEMMEFINLQCIK